MEKRWVVNKKYPKSFEKKFPEFSQIVLQLLWDRKLKNQTQIDEFFNPDYEKDLHNPFLLKDIEKAVKRIFQALQNDEKILVYGDYDVDGVTASSVMVSSLVELKSVEKQIKKSEAEKFIGIYIPNREVEGYGLNEKAIEKIKKGGADLLITVDCGVSSFENVKLAQKLGMDVIITDHHHVPKKVPEALAIINPKQENCKYPFKELAGVGVAFKLAQALIKESEKRNTKRKIKISPGFEKWLLDLVALGTVADCVDLIGENRTLVKYGLLVVNKTRRIGIKELVAMSGLRIRNNGNVIKKKDIDTTTISFVLAPRLNAAGRMEHANTSYKLLMSDSKEEAKELAVKLENNNQKRQRMTEKMIKEIKDRIEKYKELPKIIVESDKEWKMGIVGLVAGKLSDQYSRPFLVLQQREKESAGSGRSIPDFNLIESIEKCKDILLGFGGHSQAAGLKIKNSNFKKFKDKINSIANKVLSEKNLVPVVNIDCKIKCDQIGWQLIDEIEKFKPFGYENRMPVFLAEKLEIHEVRTVGTGDSHLKLCFKSILKNGKIRYLNAIGFRLGKFAGEMPKGKHGLRWGDIVDVVFQLEVNQWNGNRELQMNVLDLKIN